MGKITGTSSYIYFETDIFPGLAITEENPGLYATAYGMLADFVRAVAMISTWTSCKTRHCSQRRAKTCSQMSAGLRFPASGCTMEQDTSLPIVAQLARADRHLQAHCDPAAAHQTSEQGLSGVRRRRAIESASAHGPHLGQRRQISTHRSGPNTQASRPDCSRTAANNRCNSPSIIRASTSHADRPLQFAGSDCRCDRRLAHDSAKLYLI